MTDSRPDTRSTSRPDTRSTSRHDPPDTRHDPPDTQPDTRPDTRPGSRAGTRLGSLHLRRVLAGAAALGTLPYVTMKSAWLAGYPVGLTDPALVASRSMVVLNAVTVALDLCVVALAVLLGSRAVGRVPAVVVLLPAWIATGLLVPIALVSLPLTLLAPGAGAGMADWVRPMVYGGFTWQALCLLAAFAVYARERWADRVRAAGPVPTAVRPVLRTIAGGGAAVGTSGAVLLAVQGIAAGGAGPVAGTVTAAFGLAGVAAAGTLAAGGSPTPLRVTAAWSGTAVPFANGAWAAVTTLGATDLSAAGDPLYGLGHLCGLLGGFALAVAALPALCGPPGPAAARR